MIPIVYNDIAAQAHYNSLKSRIEGRIDTIIKRGIGTSGKIIPTKKMERFLKNLKGAELEKLIVAKPKVFGTIISDFRKQLPFLKKSSSADSLIMYNLFITSTYDHKVFDKLNFIRTIGIDTCPYCNRNYIYALDKRDRIKPQIDHFYPKVDFPFLGVSFYNLIPSCQTCNGLDAKTYSDPSKAGLRNPYLVKHDDFLFTFKIITTAIINAALDDSSIEVQFLKSVKGNAKVFKLIEFYNLHRDHIIELIVKQKVKYPKSYRNDLTKFGLTKDEIDRMILGSYALVNDVHKRPLAKLYQDIGRELGLIK